MKTIMNANGWEEVFQDYNGSYTQFIRGEYTVGIYRLQVHPLAPWTIEVWGKRNEEINIKRFWDCTTPKALLYNHIEKQLSDLNTKYKETA